MKTLPINLDKFGFVEREKKGGKPVIFRCGRDFLYYTLAYYKPDLYHPSGLCPVEIERGGIFGQRIPWWMMWSALQFTRVPKTLKQSNLQLIINEKHIRHYCDFVLAHISPKKISASDAIALVEASVKAGEASAIDIGISLFGLVDHVLFVYGYDDDNLFVFDTHQLPTLEYEKQTEANDPRFIMKISKQIVRKRWSRWGRVWRVTPVPGSLSKD